MATLKLRPGWTYGVTSGKVVHLVPPPISMAACNRVVEVVEEPHKGPICQVCQDRHDSWPADRKEPSDDCD